MNTLALADTWGRSRIEIYLRDKPLQRPPPPSSRCIEIMNEIKGVEMWWWNFEEFERVDKKKSGRGAIQIESAFDFVYPRGDFLSRSSWCTCVNVVSRDPARLISNFVILVGKYQSVGLCTNEEKTFIRCLLTTSYTITKIIRRRPWLQYFTK